MMLFDICKFHIRFFSFFSFKRGSFIYESTHNTYHHKIPTLSTKTRICRFFLPGNIRNKLIMVFLIMDLTLWYLHFKFPCWRCEYLLCKAFDFNLERNQNEKKTNFQFIFQMIVFYQKDLTFVFTLWNSSLRDIRLSARK